MRYEPIRIISRLLALAAKVILRATVKYMSVILNVFSIVTAFLALLSGRT